MKMKSNEFSRYLVSRVKHFALPILDEGKLLPCSRCSNFMVHQKQCSQCGDFICAKCQSCSWFKTGGVGQVEVWYYNYENCPICNTNVTKDKSLFRLYMSDPFMRQFLKTCRKCLFEMNDKSEKKDYCVCCDSKIKIIN